MLNDIVASLPKTCAPANKNALGSKVKRNPSCSTSDSKNVPVQSSSTARAVAAGRCNPRKSACFKRACLKDGVG